MFEIEVFGLGELCPRQICMHNIVQYTYERTRKTKNKAACKYGRRGRRMRAAKREGKLRKREKINCAKSFKNEHSTENRLTGKRTSEQMHTYI